MIQNVGIDNVVAALISSLAMMRRLEVLRVQREDNRHVPDAEFDAWRRMALGAYNTTAAAGFLKVVLSLLWLKLFGAVSGVLQVGGMVIFIAWIIAIVWAWRQSSEARATRNRLRIARPSA